MKRIISFLLTLSLIPAFALAYPPCPGGMVTLSAPSLAGNCYAAQAVTDTQ